MLSFEGQIAVVTGASRGIGESIALALATRGATVGIVGRYRASLESLGKQNKMLAEHLIPYQADLEQYQDIINLVEAMKADFKELDILVHSAGVISLGNVAMANPDDFDRQYRINVRAPFFLTQKLLPLITSRKGQVVFINSSAGLIARPGAAGYSASKHALKAIADALRGEVRILGLRVISVFPSRTATQMQAEISEKEGVPYLPQDLMQPEDIANAVIEALGSERTANIGDIVLQRERSCS